MFGLGLCLSGWNGIVEVCAGERLLMFRAGVDVGCYVLYCIIYYYILLLYIYYYYIILYSILLFFPIILLPSLPFTHCLSSFLFFPPLLSYPLPSSPNQSHLSILPHSQNTCRHLDTLIYILPISQISDPACFIGVDG